VLRPWTQTNSVRLCGHASRGQRLIDNTPHGHWKTTTLIDAMGLTGVRFIDGERAEKNAAKSRDIDDI
jgi:hypothetical protein